MVEAIFMLNLFNLGVEAIFSFQFLLSYGGKYYVRGGRKAQ
jgi:hypothetical protein